MAGRDGIIVLSLALFPLYGGVFYEAELPSPFGQSHARLRTTSVVLWLIYSGLTLLRSLCCAGWNVLVRRDGPCPLAPWRPGLFHRNISAEAFHSFPVELVSTVFMFGGLNFSLYYRVLKESAKPPLASTESGFFAA